MGASELGLEMNLVSESSEPMSFREAPDFSLQAYWMGRVG